MTDFKLDIYTTPINQTAGFIYMGYAKDKLIVGQTNKSLLKNVVSKNKTKEYIRTIVSPNLTPILAESFFKLTFII